MLKILETHWRDYRAACVLLLVVWGLVLLLAPLIFLGFLIR